MVTPVLYTCVEYLFFRKSFCMVVYTTASSKEDLEGILCLQQANLAQNIAPEEKKSQGFVTVWHTYEQLARLNEYEQHIIAKHCGRVVGYVLAMTAQSRFDIPVLVPMFDFFDTIFYKNKKVGSCRYMVVGQVCVDKDFRGQGVFDNCYAAYKNRYGGKYDFAITEIASANTRSQQAHKRVGFETIATYTAPDGTGWQVVVWDWGN